MKSKVVHYGYSVALFFAIAFVFFRLHQARSKIALYGTEPTYDAEARVNAWLMSADCFKTSHVPLVICGPGGTLIPIEEVSIADDRGHAILANAVAAFSDSGIRRETLVLMNLWIDAIGILALAVLWYLVSMRWTSLLTLIFGGIYGIPGPLPGHDAPASYFGVFCFGGMAVVWAATWRGPSTSKFRWACGLFLSVFGLVGAFILRQPIGLSAALSVVLILGFFAIVRPQGRWLNVVALGVALLLILLAMNASAGMLVLRNLIFRLPTSQSYHSHGIWHTLYLGIGWVRNPWGIRWDDQYGIEAARRVTPGVTYGTYAYFKIMRQLYGALLWHYPWQVLAIYLQKAVQVWNFPLLILKIKMTRWVAILMGLAFFVYSKSNSWAREPLVVMFALDLYFVINGAQGILAIPSGTHLYPLKFCALLLMSLWADYVWRMERVSQKRAFRLNDDGKNPGSPGAQ